MTWLVVEATRLTPFLVSVVSNETGTALRIVLQGRLTGLPVAEITEFSSLGNSEVVHR